MVPVDNENGSAMAYAPPPQYPPNPLPQEPKQRPMTVTIAVWIMYLTAIVLAATAIAQFVVRGMVEDAVEDQLRSDPAFSGTGITADDISTIVTFVFVVVAVIYLLFAAFYVVLGVLDNAGKRPARILTWILAGIALACCGFGGLADQGIDMTYTVNDQEYDDELTQALADATPTWVNALEWASLLLFIGGSLAIIILLALPASNEFFRKEVQPQSFYPGQPPYGQPPYPGQPPYEQGPPGSGQPPQPGQ